MEALDKAMNVIAKICEYVLVAAFIVMFCIMTAQIAGRYIFRYGILWSDELARYLMVWSTLLGSALLVLRDSHVRVTSLEDLFPGVIKKILNVIRYLIYIAYSIALLIFSSEALAFAAKGVSSNMRIPMAWLYYCFPTSAVLIIIFSVANLIKLFIHWNDVEAKTDMDDPDAFQEMIDKGGEFE